MTVLDLITNVLSVMNVVAVGDSIAAEDSAFVLTVLNWWLDSLNALTAKSIAALNAREKQAVDAFNADGAKAVAGINADLTLSLADNYAPSLYTAPSAFTFTPVAFTAVTFVPAAQFVNLTDTVTLTAGWLRALIYNAALDIAVPYAKEPSPSVVRNAADSLAAIARSPEPQRTVAPPPAQS